MVTNHNVVRLFTQTEDGFIFRRTTSGTMFHSAFDFSVWEKIWGALLYGGRLIVVRRSLRTPAAMARLICA